MEYEFKGSKGKLERKYVSGICIGIGTISENGYSQITANSVLPETDAEYEQEKQEIEANMLLYSKAPEIFERLKGIASDHWNGLPLTDETINKIEALLKEATEL